MALGWPSALERRIAVRYLRGQRGTRSATLQTLVAIGGIAVGVMALVVVLGVMNGLRDDLRDRILVASPHLRVLPYGEGLRLDGWRDVLAVVERTPGVVAAAPEVVASTLILNRGGYGEVAKVAGLELGTGTANVTGLDSVMVTGAIEAREPNDSIDGAVALGSKLAARLTVGRGDLLRVVAPASARTSRVTGTITPVFWTVEVTGIFETGMYIYDNEFLVMDRATAQRFTGLDSAVNTIAVRVADPWEAPIVAARLDSVLGGYPFLTETWQAQNDALFRALEIEKKGMGLVIFFIMVVAAFNIVGTLTMVVRHKTREIGILQAMGLPADGVGRIFLAQGAIIGMVGTGLGLVAGLALAWAVDRWQLIRIDASIYFIEHLPVRVEPLDVLLIVVAAVGLAVVATIHPARRAAALQPVEAIRAE
ncbi:MAG TPA: ABC transporter permease [Gemmatimonadales bacterium]|nr:ABC transporter permease [Gemmatimonadales bacterium]